MLEPSNEDVIMFENNVHMKIFSSKVHEMSDQESGNTGPT